MLEPIQIIDSNGAAIWVQGRKISQYLALTPSLAHPERWNVTHIPTGFAVPPQGLPEADAAAYATYLEGVADWKHGSLGVMPPKAVIASWKALALKARKSLKIQAKQNS